MTFIIIKERVNFGMFQRYLRHRKPFRRIYEMNPKNCLFALCRDTTSSSAVLLMFCYEQNLKLINQNILFVIAICRIAGK